MNNARVSIVTLGVENLSAATEFYKALGWKKSAMSQDTISFLKGSNVVLGLYGKSALAEDIGIEDAPKGFSAMSLAINMNSREEVDTFSTLVKSVGGTIVKEPQKVFWGGYSGYFSDLDGHYWEIAHNPFVSFDDNGNLDLDGELAA